MYCVRTRDDDVVLPLRVHVHRVERLFTDAVDVDTTPVTQHLCRDVVAVDNTPRCLTQMVQRRLPLQHLREPASDCSQETTGME